MLCGTASFSKVSLFFGDDVLRLWFEPVKDDLQHDFVSVADVADCSLVLALLFAACFGSHRLGPERWPLPCLPDLVADC